MTIIRFLFFFSDGAHLKSCCNLLRSKATVSPMVHSSGWEPTLKCQMLLTIQRLDSAVDFSVVVVCEVAMVDSSEMTWSGIFKKHVHFFFFFFVPHASDGAALPFPMMRWCCTRSISAGMRTSLTSSSSCGLKLEMEIFSAGMRGVRVGSMLPAAKARLGNTGPTSGVGGFRDATGKGPARWV